MSLLRIDAIDAYYNESHTIRNPSMNVEGGEICTLLGRNGADETITLRCTAGVTPPEVRESTIRFKDDDITGILAEDVSVRGVSLVPERRRIFPSLSVAENLHPAGVVNNKSNTFGRSLSLGHKGVPTEEVYNQFLQLDERRNQRARTFSGGKRQIFAITRALKQNTDLLLLDEPYEGLTPKIVKDAEDAVERISDAGTTVLLVGRNTAATIKLTDRVYIVDQGGIILDGTVGELHDDGETRERYPGV